MKNDTNTPPKLPLRFFRWYCHPDYREDLEGDLLERFEHRLKAKGLGTAKWSLYKEVMQLFRPGIIRSLGADQTLNHYGMLKNYFKMAWRNLLRYKMYSAIKVSSLSIGVAACLLITLYVKHELSYDQHFPDHDRIFRVLFEYNYQGESGFDVASQAPLARTLKEHFPEVEQAGRLNPYAFFGVGGNEIRRTGSPRGMHQKHTAYLDQELLEVFQPRMIEGDLHTALVEPRTMVISKSKADLYFPGENALGKTLVLDNKDKAPYVIGGVMEDFPANSHLDYDFLLTLAEKEFWTDEQTEWVNTNYLTYLKLKPNSNVQAFEDKLSTILQQYCAPVLAQELELEVAAIKDNFKFHLQPIRDVHLKSTHTGEAGGGDIKVVGLFAAIAIFILCLACINFVNLSTAKSANRAKEVGLRKTMGSFRIHLIIQFLSESILLSVVASLIGVLLAWWFLPYFNLLAAKALLFPWDSPWFILSIPLFILGVGFVSGMYPALYLSAFQPIQALKGTSGRGAKNVTLRNGLVVFQFGVSIVLIISTIVIHQQTGFILNSKVGFEKDQVILIQGTHTLGDQVQPFKNELLGLPGVQNASVGDYLPITGNEVKRNGVGFWKEAKKDEGMVIGQLWQIDEDYVETMGMKILKGQDFADRENNNLEKAIINETLAQKLGLDHPIGQRMEKGGGDGGNTLEIVGMVEDFNFQSFKEGIKGVCMIIGNSPYMVSVKANTADMPQLIRSIETTWNKFSPKQSLRYEFLDDRFEMMYGDIQRMKRVFFTFAVFAIIVACLGLFALSAFIAEQRNKEMSIRKVLGASVSNIFRLLTFNFIKLILFSMLVAVPVGGYLMQKWLEDYVYKIDLAWWFFGVAGVMVMAIALITISTQALKVSFANPVDSLKNE